MKLQHNKIRYLYILCFVLSAISTFLYYKHAYGSDFGFNPSILTIIVIPLIYIIISVVFDIVFLKEIREGKYLVETIMFLPLYLSLHYIFLTVGFLKLLMNEAPLLWCFLLFLPLLILIVFVYFVNEYSNTNLKLFLILKYMLSIILGAYSVIIFMIYRLAGLGV